MPEGVTRNQFVPPGEVLWEFLGGDVLPGSRTPDGVLPYMGYIGMCRGIGYGFLRFSILK